MRKSLFILLLLAIALFVSVTLLEDHQIKVDLKLFDHVDPSQITRVEFGSAEGFLTIERVNGSWVLPDKASYPVRAGKLQKFLDVLFNIETWAEVVSTSRQIKRYQLTPSEKTSIEFAFFDERGMLLFHFRLGKIIELSALEPKPGKRQYILDMQTGQAYLIPITLEDFSSISSWIDKIVIHLFQDQIKTISQYSLYEDRDPVEEFVLLQREGKFVLSDDEDADLQPFVVDQILSVSEKLEFLEVLDKKSIADQSFDKLTIFETNSGRKISIFTVYDLYGRLMASIREDHKAPSPWLYVLPDLEKLRLKRKDLLLSPPTSDKESDVVKP